MRKTVFLCLFIFASLIAFAYPISPRPLRLLVQESEYIVVGRVSRIVQIAAREKVRDQWETTAAILHVSEVLKGSGLHDSISVLYEPSMICPTPPYFEENTDMLVFLDKQKGKFYVHALSYGAKTLDSEGMSQYKTRITEMIEIQQMDEGTEKNNETLEWLVKCAEHRATRWEGSYELHPESDFMSYYSDGGLRGFKYYLNDQQLVRIKNAILADSNFSYSMLPLIDLSYRQYGKEMDQFLERSLANLPDNQIWVAGEILKRLQHKVNEDSYRKINLELEENIYRKEDLPEARKLIERFLALCAYKRPE